MERDEIDNLLYARNNFHKDNYADRYIDHYLEQYRIYLHIFNTTTERRVRVNEFFLGINTAIMAIMGYVETKGFSERPIFILVPFVGIAICLCWYRIIMSYKKLSRAKFKVIHSAEVKLPLSLFETEWELLGKGKDYTKYRSISNIEKYIPLIFVLLYLFIFISNFHWSGILGGLI